MAAENIKQRALKIMAGYIGQEEKPRGSNWGGFVAVCLALVGITYPASWCQALMYRVLLEAAADLGIPNPMPRTAGCLDCWNKTSPNNKILKANATPANILPGYQFILDHGGGAGHTGMVVAVYADGSYDTYEGNTNNDGSANGYGTLARKRKISDKQLKGFIKY